MFVVSLSVSIRTLVQVELVSRVKLIGWMMLYCVHNVKPEFSQHIHSFFL